MKIMDFLKNAARKLRNGQGAPGSAGLSAPRVWDDGVKADVSESGDFRCVPLITEDQPGFQRIVGLIEAETPFTFCKINHGFWERLARLEAPDLPRTAFIETPGDIIDDRLGVRGSRFAEGGMVADLLCWMGELPPPEKGLIFLPSLAPWPLADRIEGAPYQNRAQCESLIAHFVSEAHRANMKAKGFTGHEFKVAAITGGISRFLDALRDRNVILIGNAHNRALVDALDLPSLEVIEVDAEEARLERDAIRDRLFEKLEAHAGDAAPPIVLASAGGSMTAWIGFQAFKRFPNLQYVDLGGMLVAYHPQAARKINWTQAYKRQLGEAIPKLGLLGPEIRDAYMGPYGLRDPRLVELAAQAGAPGPQSTDELPAPRPAPDQPIPFIENKIYDHQRLSELLSLSIKANHHANGGPVAALLERAVADVACLPAHRKVVAVSNGTAALHIACGLHAYEAGAPEFRWVTSAFSFFSCHVGPLSNSIVIDCGAEGGFDLERLKALPLDSYDGVIYTNVFAQHSDWTSIADYCRANGKRFVVDNATGLLDRAPGAHETDAPIEIISAHHTKPWGVGEGGFVICDAAQEETARKLTNFAVHLPDSAIFAASNYKMSDLAAAAIFDRLERMPYWGQFYKWQERRMASLMIDSGLAIAPLRPSTPISSPRAHTPFVCDHAIDPKTAKGPATLRKYYRPIRSAHPANAPTPVADDLFARIFSLSNAPEMRLASNDAIIRQVVGMAEAAEAVHKRGVA